MNRNNAAMGPTDPSNDQGQQLAFQFGHMMGLIHSRFAGESLALMHETGLTLPQLVALHLLHYRGPDTISGLSAALRLSASATSTLIDKAVEKGIVDRTEDVHDRRQKRVVITEAGSLMLERLNAARNEEFTNAFSTLDPALQSQLIGIFGQVIAELSKNLHQLQEPNLCQPSSKFAGS